MRTNPLPAATASTARPFMPVTPRLANWLNDKSTGRSAPAAFLRFHRWLSPAGVGSDTVSSAPPASSSPPPGGAPGSPRHRALVYLRDGERYVVAASNDANDRPPAWPPNVQADRTVSVLVRRGRFIGEARFINPDHPDYGPLWHVLNENSNQRYGATWIRNPSKPGHRSATGRAAEPRPAVGRR